MKKRILPILLALIMVLTLLPTLALADEPANKVLIAGNNQEFTTLEAAVKEAEAGDTIYADASMTETVEVVIDGTGVNTLQAKIDAADPGAEIDLGGKYYPENLSINKSITLKNGTIDTATVIGASNLEFNNITFVNASNVINLDTNPAALYLQSVENVRVENCTFMAPANATGTTIGITTVTTENVGIINCTITGYGITAYHNPGTSNVTYEGNFIAGSKSGIAFVGTDTVLVDGNTFENANGIRVEPSWADGALCDTVVIENNSFINTPKDGYAVRVQNSSGDAGYEGALKLNENYWGTDDPADIFALIKGDALVENYYPTADKDPDSIVELDTTLVYTSQQLIEAIADANDGAVITLAPGTYDGNIRFDGKSLTIKAQYPANPEDGETPDDLLSVFTGTFNTSEGTGDDAFQEDQCVIIDGIAFKGDGLKVGNNNYNTVGELIVKNCTMECGKNLVKADNYNKYNYFVKVSGNAGAPYAKVTVNNNKVTGTPEKDVYTIQLWDVFVANVSENLIYLTDAPAGHQAINISKMAENATVIVEDNVIVNATGGIYVTTWLLGGTGDCAFTGDIDVVGNVMDVTGTPIYIGWEESAAPYGSLGANCSITDEGNYNDLDRIGLLKPEYLRMYEARVKAVREAVGPDVDIIIENHSFTDSQSAAQLGNLVKKYNIFYFEEPSTAVPQLSRFVHEETGLPIANGERIYTRWQYIEYFKQNAIQVIQPDVGTCGGITEIKKICDMAYTFDVGVQVHACGSPLSTAAALHLECAIPNFVIHEHHTYALSPYNKELCIHDYQPVDGKFSVPDLPGIGNELSEVAFRNCDKVTIA